MANYKGTGIRILHHLFKKHGATKQAEFLAKLLPAEKEIFETVLSSSWIPVETAAQLLSKAAETLFPGAPDGLVKLGREQALDHLTGIYKMLLRMTTVEFAIAQSGLLWKTYFDQGIAQGKGANNEKKVWLQVRNFPDLPAASRQVVAGYVMGVLELSQLKNIKPQVMENNPFLWVWELSWQ